MSGRVNYFAAPVESEVVFHFLPDAEIIGINSLGQGNINETFLVVLNNHPAVVLQKINREVFHDPEGVAVNGWLVTEHLSRKYAKKKETGRLPVFIPTGDGRNYYLDNGNDVWRMQLFLENTVTCEYSSTPASAYEGGRLLGGFHRDLKDFRSEQLSIPIPGFHDLPGYCSRYCAAVKEFDGAVTDTLAFCIQEVEKRFDQTTILEDTWRSGAISKRLVHGDPKSANMLLDSDSGLGVAVIDLDTVARGLLLHDIGDCLRSFCNPAGEAPDRPDSVIFDISRYEDVLRGYAVSGACLSETEQEMVYHGVRLMTYELSIRFLTDFLEGNPYFKIQHRLENLQRATAQIKLLHSIEMQRDSIEKIAHKVLVSD
jgi:hypothetical protein